MGANLHDAQRFKDAPPGDGVSGRPGYSIWARIGRVASLSSCFPRFRQRPGPINAIPTSLADSPAAAGGCLQTNSPTKNQYSEGLLGCFRSRSAPLSCHLGVSIRAVQPCGSDDRTTPPSQLLHSITPARSAHACHMPAICWTRSGSLAAKSCISVRSASIS